MNTGQDQQDQEDLLEFVHEHADLDVDDLLEELEKNFSEDLIDWYVETVLGVI